MNNRLSEYANMLKFGGEGMSSIIALKKLWEDYGRDEIEKAIKIHPDFQNKLVDSHGTFPPLPESIVNSFSAKTRQYD